MKKDPRSGGPEKTSLIIVAFEKTQMKNWNRSNNQRHNWRKKTAPKRKRTKSYSKQYTIQSHTLTTIMSPRVKIKF